MEMKTKRQQKFLLILGSLALLGMLLRFLVSVQLLKNDPFAFAPPDITDIATYHKLSDEICKGKFPDFFYYQPFYYSVFLPLAKLLTGSRIWGPALFQILCGGGIIWFAGLTAALLKGRKAGIFAGFLAAFSLILIVYTPYALLEIQQCFYFTLLAYFTIRLMKKDSILLWCGAGMILSFAILSRGNALCFLPAIFLAFLYARKRFGYPAKKMLLRAGVFLLCLILPQLPFIIRNTAHFGTLTGPSSAGPAVLALGNNPEAPPGGLDLVYPRGYDLWMEFPGSVPKRIIRWFLDSPFDFLEFQCRKFLLFWDHVEIPNNISMPHCIAKSSILTHLPLIPTGLILLFAVASFLIFLRRSVKQTSLGVFLLFPLLYALAAAAFYILARFRLPAVGLLCIQGSLLLPGCLALWKKKDYRKLLLYRGAPLLIAGVLVYTGYESYASAYEPVFMRSLRPDGVRLDDVTNKRQIIFDHGPQLPLGWELLPLKNGMEIRKQFIMPPQNKANNTKLELRFAVFQTCTLQCSINDGEEILISLAGPEHGKTVVMRNIHIPAGLPTADGIYRIRIESGLPSGEQAAAGLFMDLRRNYGRTHLDGKVFPGEAVIRLELLHGFGYDGKAAH